MKRIFGVLAVFLAVGFIFVCLTQEIGAESNAGDLIAIISKAEQGDARAQYNLGHMYEHGEVVPRKFEKAIYWYTKAAEQGDKMAQFNLGAMHDTEEKFMQDYVTAYAWYNLAASQGDEIATVKKDILLEKMSPRQIEEGQKLSRELFNKINSQLTSSK